MANSKNGFLFVLVVIFILLVALFYLYNGAPQLISFDSGDSNTGNVDKDAEEIAKIISLGYQVDVEVNSNHFSLHNSGSSALKCLSDNGSLTIFSEHSSRRLHLLCWDGKEQTLFDIIINRINYYTDKWANPKSQLITAYSPEGVDGVTMLEKSTNYINHLTKTIGGKVVNLNFGPGEIMFIPK